MAIRTTEPIGATAVRLGYTSSSELLRALDEQQSRRAKGAKSAVLGELMVELGVLSQRQLQRVLGHNLDSLIPVSDDAIRLAARLAAELQPTDHLLLMVGARRADGASLVAHQVALAFAYMGKGSILLADVNLRRGDGEEGAQIYSRFAVPVSPGLSELIEGRVELDDAVKPTKIPRLAILPAGTSVRDPLSLLLSDECSSVMGALHDKFSLVVLDAPPMLDRPDTPVLASRVDAALLVIAGGLRRKAEVATMKRILDGLRVRIVGAVRSEHAHRKD